MPYLQLPEKDVQLWYRSNIPEKDGRMLLDESKPTVLLMQGTVDTTFLNLQLDDPTLNACFNLVAFDVRSTGETRNPLDARRDTWTDAADLAKAVLILGLPACHIFSAGSPLVHLYALRLAIAWPSLVASITWVEGGQSPEDYYDFEITSEDMNDIMRMIAASDDLEELESVAKQAAEWSFGSGVSEEMTDRIVENFLMHAAELRSPWYYDLVMGIMHEPALEDFVLGLVRQPVLIIKSAKSVDPRPDLAIRPRCLCNTTVQLELTNGPPQPHTVEPWASRTNAVFRDFVLRHRSVRASTRSRPGLEACMKDALTRLSEISRRAEILERDPLLSASFSLVSDELAAHRREMFVELHALSKAKAVGTILDREGRPLRKYSERNMAHFGLRNAPQQAHPIYMSFSSCSKVDEMQEEATTPS